MTRSVLAALVGAAVLVGCSFSPTGKWKLIESGYSIDADRDTGEFALKVHVNELKQHGGGDPKTAEFRLYVAERLKRHELCPAGWEFTPCADEAICGANSRNSVTVQGRCLP